MPGLVGLVMVAAMTTATLSSLATVALLQPSGRAPAPSAASVITGTTVSTGPSAVANASDAIVKVAASASPAVVTITVESAGDIRNAFSLPSTGVGSGFIFDSNGWILTNYHVVEGGGTLTVGLDDGRQLTGTVMATDPTHDLAVVKIDATDLPTVPIGSSASLKVGQTVIAIGSPLGTFTETVTSGILSATGRSITVSDARTRQPRTMTNLLQTDAAINEGNSGGPLLDAGGNVIGINNATATSAQGIGFAVPIDEATSIIASARSSASVTP